VTVFAADSFKHYGIMFSVPVIGGVRSRAMPPTGRLSAMPVSAKQILINYTTFRIFCQGLFQKRADTL